MGSYYQIENRLNCAIVKAPYGITPIEFSDIAKQSPAGSVLDCSLAVKLGALAVIGLPKDLSNLSQEILPDLISKYSKDPKYWGLQKNELEWLAKGVRNNTTDTFFSVLTGIRVCVSGAGLAPKKPIALEGCIRLLAACPQLQCRINKMKPISPGWAVIVGNLEDGLLPKLINALDTKHWDTLAKMAISPAGACL